MLTLMRCPFHPRVTAVARKRHRSFCQKCRWQVHTHTHTHTPDPWKSEWADYVAVQAECGNLSGNELTRNSSGNARLQSSQLAEPLRTDLGIKSGISVRELIPTSKKKKKRRRGINRRTFSQKPRKRGESHHNHQYGEIKVYYMERYDKEETTVGLFFFFFSKYPRIKRTLSPSFSLSLSLALSPQEVKTQLLPNSPHPPTHTVPKKKKSPETVITDASLCQDIRHASNPNFS